MKLDKTFSEFTKKISENAKETVKKSEQFINVSKLTMEVSSKKSAINALYTEIGEKVYRKYVDEKFTDKDLEDYFKAINRYNKEIKELNKSIAGKKKMKACINCGEELSSDCKYCPSCGAKQQK